MSPERLDLRAIEPQPWKNGAGLTREIAFGGADPGTFDWRLSLAEVARDAPFSAFPGIDRCIVLIEGAGMRLRGSNIDHSLGEPLAPFRFPGEASLAASLFAGPTTDFNVMTRRGVFASDVQVHRQDLRIAMSDACFVLCVEGEWTVGGQALAPMQAVLWRDPSEAVSVTTRQAGALLAVRLERQ